MWAVLPALTQAQVLITEVTPDMNTSNTKPGWVAGLIFLFLFVSAALLMRSMTKHLKTARKNLSQPQEPTDGTAGPGI